MLSKPSRQGDDRTRIVLRTLWLDLAAFASIWAESLLPDRPREMGTYIPLHFALIGLAVGSLQFFALLRWGFADEKPRWMQIGWWLSATVLSVFVLLQFWMCQGIARHGWLR